MIHVWELAEAPAAVSFSDPEDSATTVTFSAPDRYVLRLTMDDGEAVDHTATAEVTISVVSRQMRFQRGDANAGLRASCASLRSGEGETEGDALLNPTWTKETWEPQDSPVKGLFCTVVRQPGAEAAPESGCRGFFVAAERTTACRPLHPRGGDSGPVFRRRIAPPDRLPPETPPHHEEPLAAGSPL